jgi:hypothetical protein
MKNRNVFLHALAFACLVVSCKKSNVNDEMAASTNGQSASVLPLATVASDSTIPSSGSNLIFEETVEGSSPFSKAHSWEIGSWDYALQFVTDTVYQGIKSARFEIRKDQPLVKDGKRAEIVIVKGADGDITKNTWYSFSALFPTDGYEYDKEREIINQWYQNGSPATSFRTQKDRFLLESGNTTSNRKQYDLGPITKDVWHQFVFHFIHSYNSDGLVEIWHNGVKVLTRTGGNMYNDVLPKWKIGLYKAAFKTTSSLVSKRIIYFDNVRVGNANATYEEMSAPAK